MIATEQNTPRQLQRLRAQRQLYSKAKTIFGIQAVLSGPIAVGSAIMVNIAPSTKGFVALWGILVVLGDIFWLTPWEKRLRTLAASIQEEFDCDVLQLPWNDLKAGQHPDPELIKEQSDNYAPNATKMPPLENWYAPVVDTLPIHIARLVCQRANCLWDAKQRRFYAATVITIVALIFAIILFIALKNKLTIEDLVLRVLAPLAPLFVLGLRQYTEQQAAAERIDKLKDHSKHLWDAALAGESKQGVTTRARALQDEILENRRSGPMVFNFIFKRLRSRYEDQMNYGAEEFVRQAQTHIGMK